MQHTNNEQANSQLEFSAQQVLMDTIYRDQDHGLESLFTSLSDQEYQAIFGIGTESEGPHERCSCCVDEGISLKNNQEPSARYAGSGILLGEQRARELWRQNKVTKVTSHVGCGAAKLYCQQNGLDEAQSDLIASEVLKEWANKEGLEFEFIGQLNRPSELHNARGVFVDCTEKLKANNSPHLPHMFQVTANMSAQEIAEDIKLCFAIATGDHGLGQLIAAEQPFVVGFVSSQENQEKINAIIEELNNQDWLQQQQGRIMVQVASVESTDENKNYALAAD